MNPALAYAIPSTIPPPLVSDDGIGALLMLSKEENDLITRTNDDSPLNEMMRRY
jgi:hypothetical protein